MRTRLLQLIFSLLLFALFALPASAGIEQLTEEEFRSLSAELAPKVNLFRDVWEKDPEAVFYGGTSRDYLYWIKGKFLRAKTREQAQGVMKELKSLPTIDVRDFIIGESDVDIVSKKGVVVDAGQYGVRKVDSITPDIFDPSTELGQNELWQGYVPVEKIQVSRHGIAQTPELGDGLREIYTGKLSVHYGDPAKFAQTKFAREGVNHPVLLALRYLRLQGINYFKTHGSGLPDKKLLFSGFDPKSQAETKKIINQALDGKELKPFLKQNKFKSWINGTIQKSFRSYTNPTAALEILKSFDVDKFTNMYGPSEIESVNQYVFAKHRDEAAIRKSMKQYGVNEVSFFDQPAARFPDGYIYHGTRTEPAFRGILFQGVLPSETGVGEKGLYGVALANRKFSESWGGDANRLIQFPVKPNARIVDITRGEGKRVFDAFGKGEDEFADAFGVDIVRYPYGETEAFVVKNSESLGRPQGVYRKLMTFNELLERSRTIQSPNELFESIKINSISSREAAEILKASPIPEEQMVSALDSQLRKDPYSLVQAMSKSDLWKKHGPNLTEALLASGQADAAKEATRFLKADLERTDLWRKYGGGLVDRLLQSNNIPAVEAAIDFLGTEKFPITQETVLKLLKTRNSLAAKKAMELLESGKFAYDEKVITAMADNFAESSGGEVLESLLRQKKWGMLDQLTKEIEGFGDFWAKDGGSAFREFLYLVTYARAGMDYRAGQNTLFMEKFLLKYVIPEIEPQMVAPISNALARLGDLASYPQVKRAGFEAAIRPYRELAPQHPQLVDGAVESYLKAHKIIGTGDWNSLKKKLKPGWSSDAASLKLIKRTIAKDAWNREGLHKMAELLVPLLTIDGPWEKDLDFFREVITYAKLDGSAGVSEEAFANLLKTPGLNKNTEAMRYVVDRSISNPARQKALVEFFSSADAVKDPKVLQLVAADSPQAGVLLGALTNPAWADSPETLEAFGRTALAEGDKFQGLPTLGRILDYPHWKNHPAFAHLKQHNGMISEKDFLEHVQAKYSLRKRLGRLCSSFFGKIGR